MDASIIIPAYNASEYVAEAVHAALDQTYPVREVICVDDGSSDNTLDVLRTLETQHERVMVLSGPNAGAPVARNRGLAVASAPWVQFLDADDLLLPRKIESQVHVAEEESCDVVCGGYQTYIDGELVFTSEPVRETDNWINLFQTAFAATTTMLFRREAVTACGGWTEGLPNNQDYDLVLKLLKHNAKIGYDELHTSILQRHPGSISFDFTLSMRNVRMRLNEEAIRYLQRVEEYSGRRRSEIEKEVFAQIRQMYQLDAEMACEWHQSLIGRGLFPPQGSVSGMPYTIAYLVLGFSRAEALRARLKPSELS